MIRISIRRASWGTLAVLGYLLSPLSWWNAPWVNIPIAYAAASLAGIMDPRCFLPTLLASYWITNLLGLGLLHIGLRGALTEKIPALNRSGILWWLAISFGYTLLLLALVYWQILRPPAEYLP